MREIHTLPFIVICLAVLAYYSLEYMSEPVQAEPLIILEEDKISDSKSSLRNPKPKPVADTGVRLLAPAAAAIPHVKKEALKITIVPNNRRDKDMIRLSKHQTHFHVVITNQSDKVQKLWREWCSWGYFTVRFEVVGKDGKIYTIKKNNNKIWTRNFPDETQIPSGEHHVLDIYLNDPAIWSNTPMIRANAKFPGKQSGETFKIRAVLEVPVDEETKKFGVWTGIIKSKWQNVIIQW